VPSAPPVKQSQPETSQKIPIVEPSLTRGIDGTWELRSRLMLKSAIVRFHDGSQFDATEDDLELTGEYMLSGDVLTIRLQSTGNRDVDANLPLFFPTRFRRRDEDTFVSDGNGTAYPMELYRSH